MNPSFLTWLQQISTPVLDNFFIWVTKMGNEEFYMLAIPVLYWAYSRKQGTRLGFLFLSSVYANAVLKDLFQTARPTIAQGVRVLYAESGAGYAFPSGHTQGNTVFWGFLARMVRKRLFTVLCLVLIALVAFSRMYLGLHWPIDILGGLLIGAFLLFSFEWVERTIDFSTLPLQNQLTLAVVLPVVMALVYRAPDGLKSAGFMAGLLVGLVLENRYVNFAEQAPKVKQAIKLALGLAVFFALKSVLKSVLGETQIADFTRYAIMGIWVTYIAPFIFIKTGLSTRKQEI